MTRITVDESVSSILDQITEPVVLCDPEGRTLGRFVPELPFQLKESDQCPYTAEELDRMRRDKSGGRTLAEFWRDLGRIVDDRQLTFNAVKRDDETTTEPAREETQLDAFGSGRTIESRELPEIRVLLERVKKGEQAVQLNYPKNLGLRTKFGGKPDWIQGDGTPPCESCGEPMCFVAQIDSVEHESKYNPLSKPALGQQDYMFGDVGMIYVFFCFDCLQPSCLVQYY